MTQKEKWALFLVFLEVNGVLGSYKYYRAKCTWGFETEDASNYLHEAFSWVETRQGHEYWHAISDKWVELVNAGTLD